MIAPAVTDSDKSVTDTDIFGATAANCKHPILVGSYATKGNVSFTDNG